MGESSDDSNGNPGGERDWSRYYCDDEWEAEDERIDAVRDDTYHFRWWQEFGSCGQRC